MRTDYHLQPFSSSPSPPIKERERETERDRERQRYSGVIVYHYSETCLFTLSELYINTNLSSFICYFTLSIIYLNILNSFFTRITCNYASFNSHAHLITSHAHIVHNNNSHLFLYFFHFFTTQLFLLSLSGSLEDSFIFFHFHFLLFFLRLVT